MQIAAVCFDGFGTLVEITDKRGPFRALLKDGEQRSALAREVLTQPLSLRMVAKRVAAEVDEENLQRLEADLIAECGSLRLREGIATMWSELRAGGLKVAVCSNLALPYGPPFLNALPESPDATVLSYEVGCMKPEPEIYALVCDRLGLSPEHVLFVGDTSAADIDGPRKFGMPAMLISDFLNAYPREVTGTAHAPCSP